MLIKRESEPQLSEPALGLAVSRAQCGCLTSTPPSIDDAKVRTFSDMAKQKNPETSISGSESSKLIYETPLVSGVYEVVIQDCSRNFKWGSKYIEDGFT